jgi:hypothetical protein
VNPYNQNHIRNNKRYSGDDDDDDDDDIQILENDCKVRNQINF